MNWQFQIQYHSTQTCEILNKLVLYHLAKQFIELNLNVIEKATFRLVFVNMSSCVLYTLHEKNYPKNDVNEMKTIVRHSAHSPLRSSYFLCFFTSNVIILIFKTELMTPSHFICLLYHTFVL